MVPPVLLKPDVRVTVFAEFEKLGRVFYGDSKGHVNELEFKNYKNSLWSIIMKGEKKMRSYDKQRGNLLYSAA